METSVSMYVTKKNGKPFHDVKLLGMDLIICFMCIFHFKKCGGWEGFRSFPKCHEILMRRRGSLATRGAIGFATPISFDNRSSFWFWLRPSRWVCFWCGFVSAVLWIAWWLADE